MVIHPSTLAFLSDLKHHNAKVWFDENRSRYQEARKNIIQFVDHVLQDIVQYDADIQELEAKKCLFRINRDIRFSQNKDPYKTNLGAFISKGGRSSDYAGYYIHIEPGASMIAGGTYMPSSPMLKKIRHHIDFQGAELRKVLSEQKLIDFYGEMKGDQLKTAPKGFPKDHPDIDLLRFKSFILTRHLSDEEVLAEDFIDSLTSGFRRIHPFNRFLNEAMDA